MGYVADESLRGSLPFSRFGFFFFFEIKIKIKMKSILKSTRRGTCLCAAQVAWLTVMAWVIMGIFIR